MQPLDITLPSMSTDHCRDDPALFYIMRPSEYTAAVLRTIEQRSVARLPGRAIDVGVGSGVLLAAMAAAGATELWGVDVDPSAVQLTRANLQREARAKNATILQSDLWREVPAIRFDTVVANLPHFPAEHVPSNGRHSSWSGGGRSMLDRFLDGLPARLTTRGVAWITHHALVGLDRTRGRLTALGLSCEVVETWTVYEPEERIAALTPSEVEDTRSLRQHGGYFFVDAYVLEIRP